jgi:hypothetical protein
MFAQTEGGYPAASSIESILVPIRQEEGKQLAGRVASCSELHVEVFAASEKGTSGTYRVSLPCSRAAS